MVYVLTSDPRVLRLATRARPCMVLCMPSTQPRRLLRMHTTVEQPFHAMATGRITCHPIGVAPVHFEWTGPHGLPLVVAGQGNECLDLPIGRYRVAAEDADGARADAVVDIEPSAPDAVVISRYHVTHATTGTSRDGSVEAIGMALADGWRFLWTHGTITEGPTLCDVPCGLYAAVPIQSETNPTTFVHLCPPAQVSVVSLKKK